MSARWVVIAIQQLKLEVEWCRLHCDTHGGQFKADLDSLQDKTPTSPRDMYGLGSPGPMTAWWMHWLQTHVHDYQSDYYQRKQQFYQHLLHKHNDDPDADTTIPAAMIAWMSEQSRNVQEGTNITYRRRSAY
jgi:hypothetical protein